MRIVDELHEHSRAWLLFSKQVAEHNYVKLEQRILLLQNENATTRYQELVDNHSEYIQNIPLGYLASYLGISQRHLSRVRK